MTDAKKDWLIVEDPPDWTFGCSLFWYFGSLNFSIWTLRIFYRTHWTPDQGPPCFSLWRILRTGLLGALYLNILDLWIFPSGPSGFSVISRFYDIKKVSIFQNFLHQGRSIFLVLKWFFLFCFFSTFSKIKKKWSWNYLVIDDLFL